MWQRKYAHAEPLRREAAAIWTALFGPTDSKVARALDDHAAALRHLHRDLEADSLTCPGRRESGLSSPRARPPDDPRSPQALDRASLRLSPFTGRCSPSAGTRLRPRISTSRPRGTAPDGRLARRPGRRGAPRPDRAGVPWSHAHRDLERQLAEGPARARERLARARPAGRAAHAGDQARRRRRAHGPVPRRRLRDRAPRRGPLERRRHREPRRDRGRGHELRRAAACREDRGRRATTSRWPRRG